VDFQKSFIIDRFYRFYHPEGEFLRKTIPFTLETATAQDKFYLCTSHPNLICQVDEESVRSRMPIISVTRM
jgi:hypothetical protein